MTEQCTHSHTVGKAEDKIVSQLWLNHYFVYYAHPWSPVVITFLRHCETEYHDINNLQVSKPFLGS